MVSHVYFIYFAGVFSLLRARVLLRLAFWVSVMCAGFELNRRSDDISWGAEVVGHNVMDFIERRLTTPTVRYVCMYVCMFGYVYYVGTFYLKIPTFIHFSWKITLKP